MTLADQSSTARHVRAGAPPCDPTTLRGVCAGGCGRLIHRANAGGDTRPCTLGHPGHSGLDRCPGCYSRHRRATAGTPRDAVDLTWQTDAACAATRPELFFPDIIAGQNARTIVAPIVARYCAVCPVAAACDRYAEQTKSVGLWAGVWRCYRGSSYTRTPILPRTRVAS